MSTFTIYDEDGNPTQVPGTTVACTTPGCVNAGVPITVPDLSGAVQCGPCGQWIIPPNDVEEV